MRHISNVNQLAAQQFHMEQHFFDTGELDDELWMEIADQYERMGRVHRAEFLREKRRRLLKL